MTCLTTIGAIVCVGLLFLLFHSSPPRHWGPACVVVLGGLAALMGGMSLRGVPKFCWDAPPCDPLSAWFMLIVGVLFAIGAVYGRGYLSHYKSDKRQQTLHWLMFSATLIGLMVLLTTEDLIVFLIGWEIMAIGSFFAVIFEYDHPQVMRAGLNYFVQSHVAVVLITVVFAWSISVSGDTTFGGLRHFFATSSPAAQIAAMSMLIAGFGFKAGIVPLHTWLPQAHPAAPSHISALMSGVIVKAGIYGIVRFGSMIADTWVQGRIGLILIAVGIASGLFGIVNAAVHRDFKRMLAYCTIENIGIICIGLGMGFIGLGNSSLPLAALGFGGALFHTLNHAIFKALLFFGAGNVYVRTHTRDMEELGGLGKQMPKTSAIFLIGSLAIGGLPPLGGFVSELLLYNVRTHTRDMEELGGLGKQMPKTSAIFLIGSLAIGGLPPLGGFVSELLLYNGFVAGFASTSSAVSALMVAAGCSLAAIGGISMLAFTKAYGVIFLGSARKRLSHTPIEVGRQMLWPAYTLILLMALVMLFPSQIVSLLLSATLQTFGVSASCADMAVLNDIAHLSGTAGRAMLALIVVILSFAALRHIVALRRPARTGATWGCGYAAPIDRIQYTSKSFAKTLLDLFRILLPSSRRFAPLTTEELFPQNRSHLSADMDFVDEKIVKPGTRALLSSLGRFQFVQNGSLQRYIVYGLAYIAALVATIVIF